MKFTQGDSPSLSSCNDECHTRPDAAFFSKHHRSQKNVGHSHQPEFPEMISVRTVAVQRASEDTLITENFVGYLGRTRTIPITHLYLGIYQGQYACLHLHFNTKFHLQVQVHIYIYMGERN